VCTGTGKIALRCTRHGAHVTAIGLTETVLARVVCKSRALVHFAGARHHDGTFDGAVHRRRTPALKGPGQQAHGLPALAVVLLSSGFILVSAAAQDHQRAPIPGEVDSHVTQATIHDTICQGEYTAKVRPPRQFADAIKRRLAVGLPGSSQDYELDHLVPLGLGGHPTSPNNLWLLSWPEAAVKDRDELRLHREVCADRMTLEQAQHEMLATWGPR
jgi:hypothetical protein